MMSTCAAIFATTAGWRYVLPSTMVPTRMRGTRAASALSVLHDSSMAPSRSFVLGMKWSVTQPMSHPVASMCRQRSSTPDQVWAPMLVNRPKRMSLGQKEPRGARILEILRRPHHGAPHVRRRARIEAEPFLGLLEVPAHDVRELLQLHLHVGIEGVEVVDRDQARRHVPCVLARVPVIALDVGLGFVVRAEQLDVRLGVPISDRLVGEEAQRLMIANRPAHLRVDIRLDELGTPVSVVAPDESGDGDVVQQTREDDLFVRAALLR